MTCLDLLGIHNQEEEVLSHEEKIATEKMKASMKYNGERYEVAVPWRGDRPNLCGNISYALKRLEKTEKSFRKDGQELLTGYGAVFDDYLAKGYIKKLAGEDKLRQRKIGFCPISWQ